MPLQVLWLQGAVRTTMLRFDRITIANQRHNNDVLRALHRRHSDDRASPQAYARSPLLTAPQLAEHV